MGVSLSGEYQVTDSGVLVNARVKDSCIREFKSLIQEHYQQELSISCGFTKIANNRNYKVPHPNFRQNVLMTGLVDRNEEKRLTGLDLPVNLWNDGCLFYTHLGVQYNSTYGQFAVTYARVVGANRRTVRRLVANSAWVWNIGEDGRVRITLNGLVNKHMMTIVIGNALKFAKNLDFLGRALLKNTETTKAKFKELCDVGRLY